MPYTCTIDGREFEIPQAWLEDALRARVALGMTINEALVDSILYWERENAE